MSVDFVSDPSSASEEQRGFSQRTHAPASIAAMLMSACSAGGAAMSTRSGCSVFNIVAADPVTAAPR